MRGVAFIRRPVWLAIILLSALPRIGVMAQDITPHSLGALPSPPVASAFATRPPQVRSFALMPEPDGRTAQLKIEFSKDARLPKELELQLDKPVLFRPAADNTATARIEFDVEAFLKEQATRSEFARRGALVPVFSERHFKAFDRLSFLDPEQVRTATRLKRFIPIPHNLLAGIPAMVDPPRELMITDLSVVEDNSRTFDVCTRAGTKMGTWTFGKLFTDMANAVVDPAEMMEGWLDLWLTDQPVNSFHIPARAAGMRKLLLKDWPRLADGRLDLGEAPMRLLAIVNRLDLMQNTVYGGATGEARFVFGVIDRNNCQSPPPFTVILEYGVPKTGCTATHDWAKQWHDLGSITLGTTAFNNALERITDQFSGPNVAPSKPNGSALNQLRTNENALDSIWELREFGLDPKSHKFFEATVAQTPDLGFDQTPMLTDYIDRNQALTWCPTTGDGPSVVETPRTISCSFGTAVRRRAQMTRDIISHDRPATDAMAARPTLRSPTSTCGRPVVCPNCPNF